MRLGCGPLKPDSGTRGPYSLCQKQGSGSQRPRSGSQSSGSESLRIWVWRGQNLGINRSPKGNTPSLDRTVDRTVDRSLDQTPKPLGKSHVVFSEYW